VRRRKERGGRSTTPKNKMLEMGENKYDSWRDDILFFIFILFFFFFCMCV
jgi:hypothetical protein